MDNFWFGITGSSEDAFLSGFKSIPDGTHLISEIKAVEFLKPLEKRPLFEVKWKVLSDCEFKNRFIFQKIRCFDEDESKSIRNRNILLLLFKLTNIAAPDGQPTNQDLSNLQGCVLNIKVGLLKADDGKEYNFIREIHPADYVPEKPSGMSHVDSAFSRNERPAGLPDDGIPFL